MAQENLDWKKKYDDKESELNELKLAYNNLLNDVLSFNEIISKKENTADILVLVLRLARTILDFSSGIVFIKEGNELEKVHSINLNDNYNKIINEFISEERYESIFLKQKIEVLPINSNECRIIVPIITKQKPVGLIDLLVNTSCESLKIQDLDLLWIMASIAAIEFETIQMSDRSQILAIMLSNLEKINSEDKLDNLLYLILNNLKRLAPADSYLMILREQVLGLPGNTHYCLPEIHSLDETCSLVQKAIETKAIHFIKKLSEEPLCSKCTENYLHKDNDGSLMLVPLFKGNLAYGVICIYDRDENSTIFTNYNRHIIEIFAKQATIAINNAILMDQLKKSNNELVEKQEELQNAHDELSRWNEMINKEIESAGVIQSAVLSQFDKSNNVNIGIKYKPHHSIGGDYFGIINLDEFKSLVYIGDVSGKGVPAAITNGYLKNVFTYVVNKQKFQGNLRPSKILKEVNSLAINVFKVTEQFTSVWCGIIDSSEKKVVFASAGHEYPIIVRDDVTSLEDNNGPIMGIMDNIEYSDKKIDFKSPTKLVLYTDGITDQEVETGKRLNKSWLISTIYKYKNCSPQDLCENIFSEVMDIGKDMPQHDDMLVISISLEK